MNNIKVLVVDDSKLSRSMIEIILENTDFQICGYAATGKEAVDIFKQTRPDIITMDMNLPDFDGLECSRQILALNPYAKIIMISAMRDNKLMTRGKTIGIKSFLQKPVDNHELLDSLHRVCQATLSSTILEEGYIQPFIYSMRRNLHYLSGHSCSIHSCHASDDPLTINGMAVIIGLTGKPRGRIILHISSSVMFKLAQAILDKNDIAIKEEDAAECVEELANIIAGHGASIINDSFNDRELRTTPPSTIIGENVNISNPNLTLFDITAVTNLGELKINVGFTKED